MEKNLSDEYKSRLNLVSNVLSEGCKPDDIVRLIQEEKIILLNHIAKEGTFIKDNEGHIDGYTFDEVYQLVKKNEL